MSVEDVWLYYLHYELKKSPIRTLTVRSFMIMGSDQITEKQKTEKEKCLRKPKMEICHSTILIPRKKKHESEYFCLYIMLFADTKKWSEKEKKKQSIVEICPVWHSHKSNYTYVLNLRLKKVYFSIVSDR